LSEKPSLPGDKVAIIEEFETGNNTFDDGHTIRRVLSNSFVPITTERIV
jgi:exosome complex component CSL4